MNELLKALGPVKRRLRLQRFVSGAAWGFAGGALAALILLAVTSFVPLANRWWIAGACVAGGTLLAAAINALRPISPLEAARAADACGLRERTVTALELAEAEKSTPAPPDGAGQRLADMIRLQRQDACEHLRALDAKQIRPVFLKRRLLAGALLMALCGATLLLPGDGDRAVAARQALETKTAAMAKAAEEAEKADEAGLTEKEKAELRKLTADLKRDLIASRDEADALVALDKAEQQLEKLRAEQAQEKTAGDAMSAMDAMAQTMQSAGFEAGVTESLAEDLQKLAESLTDEAKSLAEQLAEAAKQSELSESQMQALQTAAQSAQAAGTQSAMAQAAQSGQSANAQSASSMSTAQQATALQQALAGMKASLGAGQSQQSGSQASMGQGAGNNPGMSGGGAGTGSTNEEQKGGGSGQKSSGAKGTRPAEFKQTEYETIYDPEKVDAATRDVMTNQNSLGKDSVQIETGPGKGSLEGNVPYRQVVGEYAEQEARAAESANLTREQKEWVDEYFRKLTEE